MKKFLLLLLFVPMLALANQGNYKELQFCHLYGVVAQQAAISYYRGIDESVLKNQVDQLTTQMKSGVRKHFDQLIDQAYALPAYHELRLIRYEINQFKNQSEAACQHAVLEGKLVIK